MTTQFSSFHSVLDNHLCRRVAGIGNTSPSIIAAAPPTPPAATSHILDGDAFVSATSANFLRGALPRRFVAISATVRLGSDGSMLTNSTVV